MSYDDPLSAAPEPPQVDVADMIQRIQAQELSRAPAPGRLRAADVLEVKP